MRLICVALFFAAFTCAQSPAGQWISNFRFFEHDDYERMELTLEGTKLTGTVGDGQFIGSYENGRIQGILKPKSEPPVQVEGRLVSGGTIEGTGVTSDENLKLKWSARRHLPKPSAATTHTFVPKEFHHFFSGDIAPALHLNPGDTVKTWSVDAGGSDAHGVRLTNGGNPLTGPFYIEGAVPGDTLAVHLNRLRLNRDTAMSGDLITRGALNAGYVESRKKVEGYNSDWRLDREGGFASLLKPTEKLKNYRVPLAPMLGCIGVAPGRGTQLRSGFLGSFGGNMDYNQVKEGVTVYLPVSALGALLFLGDGHALQGAGELTGDALETSMDLEFTVDLQPGGAPSNPRMENADYLMASGIAGSLDDAFRQATTNLVRWLEKRYDLNAAEVSSVLGTAIVYDVAEVVDPYVHVVAKIPKSVLAALKQVN